MLGLTQAELARAIGISRSLWSVHESKSEAGPHDLPPHIARKLLRHAHEQGVQLTYEHIYSEAGD
jgi:DNA-binding XRE family transcriptional regulator